VNKTIIITVVTAYLYFLTAAASLSGFYDRWHFRDGQERYGFELMYDQTADRPSVYRQLFPRTADLIIEMMPEKVFNRVKSVAMKQDLYYKGNTLLHLDVGVADSPRYAVPYLLVYYLCLASLFVSMFAARLLLLRTGFSLLTSSISPFIFMILFPVFETMGGYYYDCGEIAFAFLFAAIFQLRWGHFLAIPVALLATFNKETFIFYLIATTPLLFNKYFNKNRAIVIFITMMFCIVMHILRMRQYAGNPGAEASIMLWDNILLYSNPMELFRIEFIYRVLGFSGYNIFLVILIISMAVFGREIYSTAMRWYFLIGGAISFSILFVFAWPGEIRNLSIFYPALLLIIAASLQRLQFGDEGASRLPCAPEWQRLEVASTLRNLTRFVESRLGSRADST
jgi:hypothetical protein